MLASPADTFALSLKGYIEQSKALSGEIDRKQRHEDMLREQLKHSEAERKAAHSMLREEKSKHSAEIEAFKSQHDSKIAVLEKSRADAISKLNLLQADNASLEEEYAGTESNLKELESVFDTLRHEMRQYAASHSGLNDVLTLLGDRLAANDQELVHLQQLTHDIQQDSQKYSNVIESSVTKLEEDIVTIEKSAADFNAIQASLHCSQAQKRELEAALLSMEGERERAEKEISLLSTRNKELECQLQEANTRTAISERKYSDCQRKFLALSQWCSRQRNQLPHLCIDSRRNTLLLSLLQYTCSDRQYSQNPSLYTLTPGDCFNDCKNASASSKSTP